MNQVSSESYSHAHGYDQKNKAISRICRNNFEIGYLDQAELEGCRLTNKPFYASKCGVELVLCSSDVIAFY
ncbi:hypothetical protein SD446_10730 [Bordetella hinzii]|jgi:hypothetical protein|uniref:hypothetical protein n=1 Tax=Bordetella hinzii TaxID=103855 RepID=UPI002A18DB31|nr:hypothetical protein [Bordetella hinzii]WPL83190.1 hypothetical protein SD446_10730 [Bordetella hinzii]